MSNCRRIEKMLEKKGIDNVEVTKHKGKYHVLHICKSNVPVPLFITEDREELRGYLNREYDIALS